MRLARVLFACYLVVIGAVLAACFLIGALAR